MLALLAIHKFEEINFSVNVPSSKVIRSWTFYFFYTNLKKIAKMFLPPRCWIVTLLGVTNSGKNPAQSRMSNFAHAAQPFQVHFPNWCFNKKTCPPLQRRVRSSREVIVQRAEVERREMREVREAREPREMRDMRDMREMREMRADGRPAGRVDEWADPWMRASPATRRRRPPTSDDSYSSTRYVIVL